jgi:hypothetical protein
VPSSQSSSFSWPPADAVNRFARIEGLLPHSPGTELDDGLRGVELVPVNDRQLRVVSREEYLRMEGFVSEWQQDGPKEEPFVRYLLVNVLLLGLGVAAWTVVVAGLVWVLS